MKRCISMLALMCMILTLFAGCGCEHVWLDATCTAPKTCSLCGKTEGDPLGHDWLEATCLTPKTCSKCGETEGKPSAEHNWIDATCSAPKTCAVCNLKQGDPLAHTPGEWTSDESVLGGKEELFCTVCGQLIESRSAQRGEKKKITVLTPSKLVMTTSEFAEHLITYLPENCYIRDIQDGKFEIFGSVQVTVYYDCENHNFKDNISFSAESSSDLITLLPHIIPAVDPELTGKKLDTAISNASDYLKNGVDYAVPLHTGVGYTHYMRGGSIGNYRIPDNYQFLIFTAYRALGGN